MEAEPRLDPVRRGRPAGWALARLTAVTMLLVVAALFAWSGSSGCDATAADHPVVGGLGLLGM